MRGSSFLVSALVALLLGCGSGGGGEASSDGASGELGSGNVRLLHASLAAPPATLNSADGLTLFPEARFLNTPVRGALLPGLTEIRVTDRFGTLLLSRSTRIDAQSATTLVLFGEQKLGGYQLLPFPDSSLTLEEGQAAFRVFHGVAGAESLQVESSEISDGIELSFGSMSAYIPVSAGPLLLHASRAVDGLAVQSVTPTLEDGETYTVIFAGDIEIFVSGKTFED